MEYQIVFDILYNVLDIIPKDVIERIIFKYTVNSNKYVFKYSIPFHNIYNNVQCERQLGVICCQNNVSTKLIDYKTGCAYNESLICTKSFSSYFTDENATSKIIYFNNNTIIDQYNCSLFKHNYNLSISRCHVIKDDDLISIYDNHIYVVNNGYLSYGVYKYDMNFDELYKSIEYTFPHFRNYTHVSIYDDVLYVCEIKKNKLHVSLHNIIDLRHIRSVDHKLVYEDDLLDRTIYKNKLYELYQFNYNIIVYDLVTMVQIYTIDISPDVCQKAKFEMSSLYRSTMSTTKEFTIKLTIADDILLISDKENTLFYEII
jgi:hypothetical protein